jgi:tetratricopeptide (TPR) repeat protein
MRDKTLALLLCGCLLAGAACSDKEKSYARHLEQAQAFMQELKYDEARIELLSAVRLKPASAQPYLLLGRALVAKQDFAGAAAAFRACLELAPDELEAATGYARILLLAKEYAEAEKVLLDGLGRHADDPGLLLMMSQAQANLGRFADAENSARKIIGIKPGEASSWLNLSRVHIMANRPKEADQALSKAESLAPADEEVALTRVGLLQRSGRSAEALDRLGKFVSSHPEAWSSRVRLGEFFEAMGRFEDAKKSYESAIAKKDDAYVQNRLGLALIFLKDAPGAEAAWEQSAKLEPRFPEPRLNLARHYLSLGDRQKTDEQIALAGAIDPEYPGLLALKGDLLLAENKFAEAVEVLEKALAQAPGENRWKLTLARAKIGRGDASSARALLLELQNTGLKSGESALLLAKLEGRSGSLDSSTRYAQAISRDPLFGLDAMVVLGDNEFARKDPGKAEAVYRRVLARRPALVTVSVRLGLSLEAQGKTAQAEQLYRSLVEEDKNDILALGNLVRLLMKENRALDAARVIEQAGVATSPEHSMLYGAVQESRGNAQAAENAYLAVLERQPRYLPAYTRLVALYIQGKQFEKAEKWLGESIEKQEKDRDRLLVMMGTLRDAGGDRPGAAKAYRAALKENPDLVPALNNLAWALAESGSLDEALLLAMKGRGLDDRDPFLADTYGWILYKQGNSATALPVLKAAREKAPLNDQIRLHLAEVLRAVEQSREKPPLK